MYGRLQDGLSNLIDEWALRFWYKTILLTVTNIWYVTNTFTFLLKTVYVLFILFGCWRKAVIIPKGTLSANTTQKFWKNTVLNEQFCIRWMRLGTSLLFKLLGGPTLADWLHLLHSETSVLSIHHYICVQNFRFGESSPTALRVSRFRKKRTDGHALWRALLRAACFVEGGCEIVEENHNTSSDIINFRKISSIFKTKQ